MKPSLPDSSTSRAVQDFLARDKKLLIDGKWVDAASGKKYETKNPSNGELLAWVAEGGAEDIDRAVAAARRAFDGAWGNAKPAQRQRLMLAIADIVEANFDELAMLDSMDMGAPITRTQANRDQVVGTLRYFAGVTTSLHGETMSNSLPGEFVSYTTKEPVGVVGAITAWNGPIGATVCKMAPVLATGCTMVLKVSEESPLSALRLGEMLLEAGIPDGVVNIVPGKGETAGARLAEHSDVDKVAFTGSSFTGQRIVRASAGNLKRVSLELGGKSPNIVFSDANLDAAVAGASAAIFANSGQMCTAGSRLFVQRDIYEEFTQRLAAFSQKLKVGDSLDPRTQLGPLVSEQQLERVVDYLNIGRKEGARALTGGERLTEGALAKGYFVPPTIFSGVKEDMRIVQEEIFGPVVVAIPFDGVEDVARMANATPFGLGSGVWTSDITKAHILSRTIRAGSVWINCYNAKDPAVPYGGFKMSGYGRELGLQHVEEYLNVKAVWIKVS
ncbi:aldehyde dehydrogenase family protein [Paraburkholderia caribensis]|uniref:aldehyde dehydrogenase family protein n=1 Tax=Paraburkholderia caribensis TaxID=75105 RepID=UPI001CB1A9D9|nr:aldehyde dehydrogenase family protein [Paraburkholderia caribensis]CAG9269673.1 Putative aldehyde dehydrogenase DhaS [Paraburkholderia caribensis]